VKPEELFHKANVAVASSELLFKSGDFDGACNRAYYAMFDAARAVLLVTGSVADLATIKTHNGLISAFSLYLVKTGLVSVELGKSINKVEDLRLLADYKGDEVESDKAQWALKQAQEFVEVMRLVKPQTK
jgi:uncharacterized protein (UPF0332 family)